MTAIIRLACEDDAEQIAAIYAPYVLHTPISFELEPPTPEQMRQRIREVLQRMPWLVCADGDQIMGYVYASPHRSRAAYQWSVDVAVYIDAKYHRCGLGRALYTSLFGLLRLQGYYNAYAGITLPNAASVGVHEALGFALVGIYRSVGYKLGVWHDVGWWQLPLLPRTAPEGDPQPLSVIHNTEAGRVALEEGLAFVRLAAGQS
jgi:L-amino acid N-acyltransferase YncA